MTSIPAAVETIKAGICVTKPSPTVSLVKVSKASPKAISRCATPITIPPTILLPVINKPATASPLTNLAAPSIAPKKELSSSSSVRRFLAVASSVRPDERSASIAICLPGIASRVNLAATSAIRVDPFVITMKFTITRIPNTIIPMTKFPPMTKPPKASITFPAASVP